MDDWVRRPVQVTNHASRITLIDAILPAGGRISGAFAEEAGAEVKALIRIGGKTLLEQVIGAVRETGRVRRVVVIGPEELREAAAAADRLEPEGDGGIENLMRGLEWLRQANGGSYPDRVLISATDLPFLTREAVNQFLDACPEQADICIPAFLRAETEARFPDSPVEYVRLGQEQWGTGSVFLIDPAALVANRGHIEDAFAARKNTFEMLKLLGPVFITKFLTHRLTIEDIEARVSKIFGYKGVAVKGCSPEMAFDIDLPEEYRYAVKAKDSYP